MPWTARDAKRHIKGLSPHQATIWSRVANSMLSDCMKKGGSQSACEGRAIAAANAVAKRSGRAKPTTNQLLTINTTVTAPIKRMRLHERDYLTAPAVLIVCGVLNQALIRAEELRPNDWNGTWISINHPCDPAGVAMSARDPDILATHGVGHVYRAKLGEGMRSGQKVPSLQAELWLDTTVARALGGEAQQALTRLERGEPLELSTGFYSQAYPSEGTFHGVAYNAILYDIRPDHLALLPNAIGACDWQSGCGAPRINMDTLTYESTAPPCACPDPTDCHCHDSPSAEELPMADPSPTRLARMWQVLRDLVIHAEEPEPAPEPPDDAALRERLLQRLLEAQGADALPVTIHAIDPETASVVYEIAGTCYQRYYAEEDGVLAFAGDAEEIELTEPVSLVPDLEDDLPAGDAVDESEEETAVMATDAKTPSLMVKTRANRLIANGDKTGWSEIDRARLEAMDEATLIRLETLPQAAPTATPREGYRTLADALEDVEPEEREGLEDALATYRRRKSQLIDVILANKQNPFVKEELQAMKAERLEKLVVMAGDELPDTQTKPLVAQQYAGRRMPQLRVVQTEESEVPPMPDTMSLIVNRQKELGLR